MSSMLGKWGCGKNAYDASIDQVSLFSIRLKSTSTSTLPSVPLLPHVHGRNILSSINISFKEPIRQKSIIVTLLLHTTYLSRWPFRGNDCGSSEKEPPMTPGTTAPLFSISKRSRLRCLSSHYSSSPCSMLSPRRIQKSTCGLIAGKEQSHRICIRMKLEMMTCLSTNLANREDQVMWNCRSEPQTLLQWSNCFPVHVPRGVSGRISCVLVGFDGRSKSYVVCA